MKIKAAILIISFTGLSLLAGCGGGATGGVGAVAANKDALAESQSCIVCHDAGSDISAGHAIALTPGTQKPVVTEWMASTHNTKNGASCRDCHGSGTLHETMPKSCSACHGFTGQSVSPLKNPDRDGQCANCHAKINPRPGQNDGYNITVTAPGVPAGSKTRFTHFSTGMRANFVSSSNKLHCRNCHDPHDTSLGRELRTQWAESGHGNTRGLARVGLDAKTRGTSIPLDQNINNRNYCVRCHTSTGFINFVAGDAFTNINALPDIGADGLPNPNGFRSNFPEYGFKSGDQRPYVRNPNGTLGVVRPYADTSREATNCNVCHIDIRNTSPTDISSYSGTMRKVAIASGVKIYYPYSSSGTGHFQTITTVQYDTMGNSNLCLTCHSGRATGQTIRTPGLDFVRRPSSPSVHDFAGGAVLQGEKTAFLFYTSPSMYKTFPAHRIINTDGNGSCISCHMPKLASTLAESGIIHSHLFRPVTWTNDDINAPIIDPIISNLGVCASCHFGASGSITAPISPKMMNDLRTGFRLSVLILQKLLPSSSNWTGKNSNGGLGATGPTYGNALVPTLGGLPAGAYTMGANYNYGFLFNEPSSYNHSPILARQLIYDSIDWLKNGAAGFGSVTSPSTVYTAIKGVPMTAAAPLNWNKVDPIQGAILAPTLPNKTYNTFTSETDRNLALFYICKDYVDGSNVCNRW